MAAASDNGERSRRSSQSQPVNMAVDSNPNKNLKKKRSTFLAEIEMRLELPDLPSDGKLLRYPIDSERFYAFCASSLEIRSKPEYFPEQDLGIPIEAIDPDAYKFDGLNPPGLHPDDELILQMAKDCLKADRLTMTRRREQFQQEFPVARWFRKPEIMSNSLFAPSSVKRDMASEPSNLQQRQKPADADTIIQQIEESFVQHREKLVHCSNPSLKPVSVLPLYPHDDLAQLDFSHVMFDRPVVDPRHNDGISTSQDNLLIRSDQARVKDLFILNKSLDNVYEWRSRYIETLPNTKPDNKDRLFFLLTPSAALYGDLSTRESLQRLHNIDALSEEERSKIPSTIILQPDF